MIRAAVIEDNNKRLQIHEQNLKRRGCHVVGYTSVDSGISGIATSPGFDLVISDLNFDPDDDSNDDGLKIADYLKNNKYPALSVVCSAKYRETDIIFEEAKKKFDTTLPHDGGVEQYTSIVDEANRRKNERIESSSLFIAPNIGERSNKIRAVYEFDSGNNLTDTTNSHFNDGYKLLIVEPIHSEIPCGNPFFLWANNDGNGWILEVFKCPYLYAHGLNLDEALENLNDLMVEYFKDLENETNITGPAELMQKFLMSVYVAD